MKKTKGIKIGDIVSPKTLRYMNPKWRTEPAIAPSTITSSLLSLSMNRKEIAIKSFRLYQTSTLKLPKLRGKLF